MTEKQTEQWFKAKKDQELFQGTKCEVIHF